MNKSLVVGRRRCWLVEMLTVSSMNNRVMVVMVLIAESGDECFHVRTSFWRWHGGVDFISALFGLNMHKLAVSEKSRSSAGFASRRLPAARRCSVFVFGIPLFGLKVGVQKVGGVEVGAVMHVSRSFSRSIIRTQYLLPKDRRLIRHTRRSLHEFRLELPETRSKWSSWSTTQLMLEVGVCQRGVRIVADG